MDHKYQFIRQKLKLRHVVITPIYSCNCPLFPRCQTAWMEVEEILWCYSSFSTELWRWDGAGSRISPGELLAPANPFKRSFWISGHNLLGATDTLDIVLDGAGVKRMWVLQQETSSLKSQPHYLFNWWHQATYLTSLSLSCFICKMPGTWQELRKR